ncbi:hypothetical protein DOTSEDRAFT_131971 [Dothistroma septosporum NZE10]|uniref:DNA topoisomerase (ATP-hydrolyzing) n=1 Tax=Dothistroma septosporum (strain NZE10 / CBS 128990) TaxID=675120 RepID=M2YLA7_DOTSN|nr:hypothetical protein DOTSEDRAFT_131971 [Dothistroma septosporum NZE10]
MADALLNDKNELSITLKVRNSRAKGLRASRDGRAKQICFPGKTEDEAWRFAVVLRILELMHEALRNDVVMSKRDIYYRDPALFGNQTYVDRYVDDIALTFGLSRASLNVCAVAKGLVAGAFTIYRKDGSSTIANNDREGLLVPSLRDIQAIDVKMVNWILVIEKEATFRSITAGPFWDTIATQGIVLTGKGYPDLSTRALLHFLSTASPENGFASPPVYGLADFDPDGLSILSTYRRGSKSLAHESEAHCIPQLQWLGLRSENLYMDQANTHASQGLLKLTTRDRKKAVNMLVRNDDWEVPEEWKAELRTMLMLNTKAELQLLDATRHGTADLLTAKLSGCT